MSSDRLQTLLEQHLGGWKAPAAPVPHKNLAAVTPPSKPRVFLVNRTSAEQSTILAGYAGPPRSDPQFTALTTLNTILGGGFVSRLNMNLREDKHWAYGAGSGLVEAEGPGPYFVSASVQTDKTAESMQEILSELQSIQGPRPPTEEEIRYAKDSMVLTLPGDNETVGEVAASYANVLTFGLPDDYWNRYVGDVNGLTAAELGAAAARLARPEQFTWVIVGDLATVEAKVRALNIGEVAVLDADGNVLR